MSAASVLPSAPPGSTAPGLEFSAFGVFEAMRLGADLRRACATKATRTELALVILQALRALEHEGHGACILVRAFARSGARSPAAANGGTSPTDAPPQDSALGELRVIAARGLELAWSEVELVEAESGIQELDGFAPVAAELAQGLRELEAGQALTRVLELDSAELTPTARHFVSAYGIRAIFGFGALAWPGEPFVISGFVRSVPGPELARALEILATHACLAWLDSRELELPIESVARERARAATLERLLSLHDRYVLDARLAWEHQLESARAERELTAANVAGKLEEQNRQLRRTQRAMLNVIEDLREAREALASKVEQRTRELAAANELLQMRNRDLEEFVYIASHDLQEPLRTVAGYLQMVERRYGSKLGVEADEFIRFAIDGAHRMQALIESLLFYSRVATKDKVFERIALDDALDEALKNLALRIEETGATIERGPLPHLRGDRTQMVQLFQNLLANALKFAGDKPPRVHVTGELAAGLCTIRVRDEGIGFNPKYADRIFKVFRRLRRDTEGTGIGLAVCKKIVERHGGRIEAESSPGEGATFSAHFPIDPTREREGEP